MKNLLPGLYLLTLWMSGFQPLARAATPSLTTFARLGGDPNGFYPHGAPIPGPDGNFYGTTEAGGPANCGTVYKATPDGVFTTLYAFNGGRDGSNPGAALTLGADGNFYGTTPRYFGTGSSTQGTVFRVTPAGVFTTIHTFSAVDVSQHNADGADPQGALALGTDGNFYGVTDGGGAQGDGTVFKVTPAGMVTSLHSFSGASSTDFYAPNTALARGNDGNFYGSVQGGSAGAGAIFQITPDGTLTILYSFTGGADGGLPGALLLGNDGNFYGLTQSGSTPLTGVSLAATAFRITPTGALTTLHTFNNATDGTNTQGGAVRTAPTLIQGADGNFYGTTQSGGPQNGVGTVFQMTPAGVVAVVYTFSRTASGAVTGNLDGSAPVGLAQGSDGSFYGITAADGGPTSFIGAGTGGGTLFKLTPAGALTTFSRFTPGGMQGSGGLLQASDGNFYGATLRGGANAAGTLFSLTPTGALSTFHSFDDDTDGSYPNGSLLEGDNGTLYGSTANGSSVGAGAFFSFAPSDAPVPASARTVVPVRHPAHYYHVDEYTGYDAGGSLGDLLKALETLVSGTYLGKASEMRRSPVPNAAHTVSDTGTFYGTAYHGGANGFGGIYSVTATGTFANVYSFKGAPTDGAFPQGSLVVGPDGTLYGATEYGGANNAGTIFSCTPGGTVAILYSFAGNGDGAHPYASLALGSDGNFYGTTALGSYDASTGQSDGNGTIFQITPGGVFTTLHTFADDYSEGSDSKGALLQAADGNFYGTTSSTVFSLTPAGVLTVLGQIGQSTSPLIQATDGNLYGMTLGGGTDGAGVVFKVDLNPATATGLPTVTLTAAIPSVAAGSGQFGEFLLTLSNAAATDTVVSYVVKGTAVNGTDYVLLNGTKKIKAGKTSKPIKVVPQGNLGGAKKTVKLVLSAGDGYTVGATGSGKVKILPASQ